MICYAIALNGDAGEIMITSLDRKTIGDARLLNVVLVRGVRKDLMGRNLQWIKASLPERQTG